jgi:predicted amidophosphoribosyltransferase
MVQGYEVPLTFSAMAACSYCSTELLSDWKFCIQCGRTVIPAAFRPDPDSEQQPARRWYAVVLIATVCLATAIAGIAVAFYFARG